MAGTETKVDRPQTGMVDKAVKIRSEPQRAHSAWEYLVVTAEAEDQRLLAEYGVMGWELVSVVREFGSRVTFYFKRRRVDGLDATAARRH